jgi:hypothetical protein
MYLGGRVNNKILNFLGKSVFMSTNYLVKIFSLLGLLLLRVYGSVQVNLVFRSKL